MNSRGCVAKDIKGELLELLLHKAFYPVLMAERNGPDKTKIEHVQEATRAEIKRFRNYGSVEEVIINFKRVVHLNSAYRLYSELKSLNLPVLKDLRDEFERKAEELGLKA